MTGTDILGDLVMGGGPPGPIFGVVPGVVTSNSGDPQGMGRVKVKLPWLSDTDETNWARIAAPMAGPKRGLYLLPEVGDEVLVAFEHGRIDRPYVLGALWNGEDAPPASNDDGKNNLRVLVSRSGHTITLDDTEGSEKITIVDKSKDNQIVFDAAAAQVKISAGKGGLTIAVEGSISLESTKGDISISCNNFSVKANQAYTLDGPQGTVKADNGIAITCLSGVDVNSGALVVR